MNELLTVSALELARRIRAKEVSPVEVVDAHIARIETVNPRLNAVCVPTFDEARAAARRAESRVLHDPERLPPLHGVPCTIKECYGVAGLPQTGGLVARRTAIAPEDATAVRRLKEAGAIVLGLTNVPEALMWWESVNKIYGRTSNAHSMRHIAGGSSGGEGAIIGAGGSPFGLGGDIGGSIRNPAYFNGVVGHKPSAGLVPNTGQYPMPTGELGRYNVTGPLARRVRDAWAVLKVLSGPDGVDPSADGAPLGEWREFDPKEVRVFYFTSNRIFRPTREVAANLRRAASALAEMGLRVERWTPPGIERALEIWLAAINEGGGPTFAEVLGDGVEIDVFRQLFLEWPRGRSPHIFPSLGLAFLEKVGKLIPGRLEKMAEARHALRRTIEEKLGESGVLLCPTWPTTAPRHGRPILNPFHHIYCGAFNPLELPATTVPTGFDGRGLPHGVQIVARHGRDDLGLWVAERVEEAFGGWRMGRGADAA